MVKYSKVNVQLRDVQLKKEETTVKSNTRTTLRIILIMFDGNNLPYDY